MQHFVELATMMSQDIPRYTFMHVIHAWTSHFMNEQAYRTESMDRGREQLGLLDRRTRHGDNMLCICINLTVLRMLPYLQGHQTPFAAT